MSLERGVGWYLCKGELIAPVKVRRRILKKRLNLLDDTSNSIVRSLISLLLRLGPINSFSNMRLNLARVRIHEESHPRSRQRTVLVRRRGEEIVGIRIYEELSDDGGLGDDLAIVDDGWDEAAGVDLQVFWGSGGVEINDFFLEGETKFGEGDVCPVRDCGG
jgi:hypothetical protein